MTDQETRELVREVRLHYEKAMAGVDKLLSHLADEKGLPLPVPPSIALIQRTVCEHYRVPLHVMQSRIRKQSYVVPRWVAMTAARSMTNHSLSTIAKAFDRDHGTVIHAIKGLTIAMEHDAQMKNDVYTVMNVIKERSQKLEE